MPNLTHDWVDKIEVVPNWKSYYACESCGADDGAPCRRLDTKSEPLQHPHKGRQFQR